MRISKALDRSCSTAPPYIMVTTKRPACASITSSMGIRICIRMERLPCLLPLRPTLSPPSRLFRRVYFAAARSALSNEAYQASKFASVKKRPRASCRDWPLSTSASIAAKSVLILSIMLFSSTARRRCRPERPYWYTSYMSAPSPWPPAAFFSDAPCRKRRPPWSSAAFSISWVLASFFTGR